MPSTPTTLRKAFDFALDLHRAGRLEEAERIYRQILAKEPRDADAHHLLAMIAHDRGRHDEAVELASRAVALNPAVAQYHNNLGVALRGKGRTADAIAAYRNAVRLDPSYADGHFNLGNALRETGDVGGAIEAYRAALKLRPGSINVCTNLANVFREQGLFDEAAAAYSSAIALQPDLADAHDGLAYCLAMQTRISESLVSYRRAVELRPDLPEFHSHLIQTMLYDPSVDGAAFLAECRRWNERHAKPLMPPSPRYANDRSPDRRLRIGYVSADFRDHACAIYSEPLLANHDHEQFEIFCYAEIANPDDVTSRLQSSADTWNNIIGMSDQSMTELIHRDRIDILVDLNLHTTSNRLLVFARKPAPVQMSWLGYPGTTGLDAIGYRLTDPYLDPADGDDARYAERSIRLPDSFWCYSSRDHDISITGLPAAERGFITFGSMNSPCKINDVVIDLWASALRAVPSSKMKILIDEGGPRERIVARFLQNGIAADRIEFEPRRARREYLALFGQLDIALDTFPYNGQTTTLDGIWMGVPTITLVGSMPQARAGLSLLTNLGLTEFLAGSTEDFERVAERVCKDFARLSALRSSLRSRLQNSVLMDGKQFARNVEQAYRTIWRANSAAAV